MDKAQSDLIEWYKLETEFFQDHVRHTRYVGKAKKRNKTLKEDWSNCGELGRGGFGVVNKQVQKATGHYRAVKTIDKRVPSKPDYSRELLVMAILAKRPSLFVEFLGWFEEPETLYIAMEYLEEGDLSKHVGTLRQETVQNISKQILEGLKVMHQQGIAHRDLKPANIFVVSISPVWVKLGDFGVSKRILAHATTALHTQVSTRVYSAPEVLGLDSNSETSEYTNSVDIWSLGCVIYELLVGTKLFASEVQVYHYYFEKWLFPKDKLKRLSPPTDDVGISLLRSMLVIQPKDRPTAADALSHAWLAGLKSDNEDSGDNQDETTQFPDESTPNRKRKNRPTTHDEPKKRRRSERNRITPGDTRRGLQDVAIGAHVGPQRGGNPTPPKYIPGTLAMPPSAIASAESSVVQTEPRNSQSVPHTPRTTNSKSPKALRKKQVHHTPGPSPQNNLQAIPQSQTLTVEIVLNQPRGHAAPSQNSYERERTKPTLPPMRKPHQELRTSEPPLPGAAGSGQKVQKTTRTNRYPRGRGDSTNKGGATISSIQNPNIRRNRNSGQVPDSGPPPKPGGNPNPGPDGGGNPNPEVNRNPGRRSNR